MTSSDRVSPAPCRWISLAAGGFFLTLLLAGVGTQLALANVKPGPADRLVWPTSALFALSYLGSTLLIGSSRSSSWPCSREANEAHVTLTNAD
jgi:hypothetical protein